MIVFALCWATPSQAFGSSAVDETRRELRRDSSSDDLLPGRLPGRAWRQRARLAQREREFEERVAADLESDVMPDLEGHKCANDEKCCSIRVGPGEGIDKCSDVGKLLLVGGPQRREDVGGWEDAGDVVCAHYFFVDKAGAKQRCRTDRATSRKEKTAMNPDGVTRMCDATGRWGGSEKCPPDRARTSEVTPTWPTGEFEYLADLSSSPDSVHTEVAKEDTLLKKVIRLPTDATVAECKTLTIKTINGAVLEDLVPMTRYTSPESRRMVSYTSAGNALSPGVRTTSFLGVREPRTRMAIHMHEFGGQTCVVDGPPATVWVEGIPGWSVYPAGTCYYMPPGVYMTSMNLGCEKSTHIDMLYGAKDGEVGHRDDPRARHRPRAVLAAAAAKSLRSQASCACRQSSPHGSSVLARPWQHVSRN
jgi:hypothetical protein